MLTNIYKMGDHDIADISIVVRQKPYLSLPLGTARASLTAFLKVSPKISVVSSAVGVFP